MIINKYVPAVPVLDWQSINIGRQRAKVVRINQYLGSSVVDPKLFVSDPDPTFQEISDPDPISDPT